MSPSLPPCRAGSRPSGRGMPGTRTAADPAAIRHLRGADSFAKAAPHYEMLIPRHGGSRVELKEAQPGHGVEDIPRPLGVEKLSRDRDLACPVPREANHRPEAIEAWRGVTNLRVATRTDDERAFVPPPVALARDPPHL